MRAPLTHVILAGLFASARRLIGTLADEWNKADQKGEAEERARWQRDLPLLMVADKARTLRTEAAWKQLAGAS
jgi:acyl-CoA dehydrogenase